ncbi:mucin-2-like [Paramacrobiotus metropolitanus]|uniref:mucin-2-like n=1 Tax=Paramacrobiotus metropolitanus TaxID=2943436 RepID=UPI00244589FC|nr:mucin-2-like [Paramacrobiotus metropolitanus]
MNRRTVVLIVLLIAYCSTRDSYSVHALNLPRLRFGRDSFSTVLDITEPKYCWVYRDEHFLDGSFRDRIIIDGGFGLCMNDTELATRCASLGQNHTKENIKCEICDVRSESCCYGRPILWPNTRENFMSSALDKLEPPTSCCISPPFTPPPPPPPSPPTVPPEPPTLTPKTTTEKTTSTPTPFTGTTTPTLTPTLTPPTTSSPGTTTTSITPPSTSTTTNSTATTGTFTPPIWSSTTSWWPTTTPPTPNTTLTTPYPPTNTTTTPPSPPPPPCNTTSTTTSPPPNITTTATPPPITVPTGSTTPSLPPTTGTGTYPPPSRSSTPSIQALLKRDLSTRNTTTPSLPPPERGHILHLAKPTPPPLPPPRRCHPVVNAVNPPPAVTITPTTTTRITTSTNVPPPATTPNTTAPPCDDSVPNPPLPLYPRCGVVLDPTYATPDCFLVDIGFYVTPSCNPFEAQRWKRNGNSHVGVIINDTAVLTVASGLRDPKTRKAMANIAVRATSGSAEIEAQYILAKRMFFQDDHLRATNRYPNRLFVLLELEQPINMERACPQFLR